MIDFLPLYTGRLGLVPCPGTGRLSRHPGSGSAAVESEVETIARWPARLVVSLMEPAEFRAVGVAGLPEALHRRIPLWLHLPIRDHDVPGTEWLQRWRLARLVLAAVLQNGDNAVIHCLGGLGRTGTVGVLCLLDAGGDDPASAIGRVRQARSVHVLETPEQVAFVHAYRPDFRLDADSVRRGLSLWLERLGRSGDSLEVPVPDQETLDALFELDGFDRVAEEVRTAIADRPGPE